MHLVTSVTHQLSFRPIALRLVLADTVPKIHCLALYTIRNCCLYEKN